MTHEPEAGDSTDVRKAKELANLRIELAEARDVMAEAHAVNRAGKAALVESQRELAEARAECAKLDETCRNHEGSAKRLRDDARTAIRGHTPECSARKPFFGTASEDPGCDCGFQSATQSGLGREVYKALAGGEGE